MTNYKYTDEALLALKSDPMAMPGPKNAAPYLLTIPEEHRPRAVSLAHLIMNMSPGWNYSGAVYQAVKNLKAVDFGETADEAWLKTEQAKTRRESEERLEMAARMLRHI